ncbi:molecular chaperone TorD family protein [Anderseniella sp. Alg231-50]|uniref:molecular chaperone TorD family protein n=1 Tax=Anderseniella sp. Alg231-50 TaxID=1922226 RepID=UPI00307B89BF
MTPLERSAVYGGFAAAFRTPDGGTDALDEAIVPPPPQDAARAFMAAFDPSISKTAVSLHASAHTERDQTDLYQELIRWYDHFGLKRRDGGELPDHLSVMLEFLQFLTAQEHANAGDAAAVSSLHAAQKDFVDRQLLPLVETVTGKLETQEPRYHALPLALRAFLEDELAALTP